MKHAEIRSFAGSNLAGDAKGNKKGFSGSCEQKTKKTMGWMLSRAGNQLTKDTGKAEVFNVFLASGFTIKVCSQASQVLVPL